MLNVIKFPFAWLITTLLWVLVWIPFYILGFLLTWIGLIFTNRNSEHMFFPWWFWDNNHGINGTLDYNNLNWVYLCNPQENWKVPDPIAKCKEIIDSKKGNERTYGKRWQWVTWRNPVTNVSMYLIGVKINKPVIANTYSFGPFEFEIDTSGSLWYYGFTLKYSTKKGFYYGFGWKFTDPSDGRARFVYRISPFRSL